MGSTGGDKSVDSLRRRLLAVGEQLIAELAREDKLSERGFKRPDDATILKEWKESRRIVETLAEKYAETIAEYRQAMEQTIRVQPKRRRSCWPTPSRSSPR
jgi:CRISPR/Cas system-associated endonuclease Cas1